MPSEERAHNRLLDWMLSIMFPILLGTVGHLSNAGSRRLASFCAMMFRAFNWGGMKLIRANIAVAFPELSKKGRNSLAKKNVFNCVWNWIDFIRLLKHPERSGDFLEKISVPEDLTYPCIVCIPHIGSWELFAQGIPHHIQGGAAAVAALFPYPKLNEILERSRTINGLEIIPREGAVRGVFAALRRNVNVGILIDQNLSPRHGGVFVDFFGLPVPTSPLPALAAVRRGVALTSGACIRGENGRFSIVIRNLGKPGAEETVQQITQRIISANEQMIREWPEQYTWLYKRWFYTPVDLAPELAAHLPFYAKAPKYSLSDNVEPRKTKVVEE
ncbi:MAG: lysophospholipid acyltransferase family protein [Victivallales bacterium]|nr:lysophospholipid acyltransferase family protein [Victivallales bacterium]